MQTDGVTETVKQYYAVTGMTFVPLRASATMRSGAAWSFFLTDHLGSVVGVTDNAGALTAETRYMPFGEVRSDVGTISSSDYGYTFQQMIMDTGLMDYDARAYDPWLGRFVQPDTIVPDQNNPLNWNRYTYAIGNPILYNDPSGHCIWDGCIVEAMIVFAVIGGVYGYGVQVTTNYQLGYSGSDAWTENIAPEPIIDGVIFAPAIPLMAPEVLAGAGYGLYSAGQSISTIPIIRVASAPLTNVGTTTFAASNTLSTFLLGPSIQKTTNDIFIKGQTTNKNTSSPDFLGQSNGPSIVIPTGVSGPKPTNNGNGVQYTGGVGGGNGLSSQTTGVRIMDPTLPNASSPGYPNGYVTYMNKSGQAINPYTGRTIERSNYWWHLPRRH